MPIAAGIDPAVALHAAKIAECGALCARPASAAASLLCTIGGRGFNVEPLDASRTCTPESVAMHTFYEQASPHHFRDPGGVVDLTSCTYHQLTSRSVQVEGSRWIPSEKHTLKLEGAACCGYRSISIAGIRDPAILDHLDMMEADIRSQVEHATTSEGTGLSVRFLRYGLDGVPFVRPSNAGEAPPEIGLLIDAVAPTQELADRAVSVARAATLHYDFPSRKTTAGNLAFPFSPSEFSVGPVFEFAVYHVLEINEPEAVDLFPVRIEEVGM
jgi:hypothetical protein